MRTALVTETKKTQKKKITSTKSRPHNPPAPRDPPPVERAAAHREYTIRSHGKLRFLMLVFLSRCYFLVAGTRVVYKVGQYPQLVVAFPFLLFFFPGYCACVVNGTYPLNLRDRAKD